MGPAKQQQKENLNLDVVLQAVIVADSFNEHFRPLSLSKPRCLIPIANTPMIEYALESLALSGVEEIFVVCCSHSEQIKEYLSNSRWSKSTLPIVKTIVSQELRSMGDALRDLDAKQLIQSDFILMSGDVISNVNLAPIVEAHRDRKLTDKNSIMTLVLKQASLNHASRSKFDECIFVVDAQTSECLRYEPFPRFPSNRKLTFNSMLFKNHSELLVRNDLMDCQIDICSVEVPALFTENFDYQDIRKDFLTGILESELLGKTVYTHILKEGYAAHVSSQQMYRAVSKDIMMRWTYPLSPDNFSHDDQYHTHSSHNLYRGESLEIDRSVVLKECVVIGNNSEIGKNCKISHSVIGRNCKIGRNVIIEGSFIFDNTVISDNCEIHSSIIGDNVEIFEGVTISKGCLLEENVKIGPNIVLPLRSRISNAQAIDEYESQDGIEEIKLGLQSLGFPYTFDPSDDEDFDFRNIERGFVDYQSPGEYSENDLDSDFSGEEEESVGDEDENDWVKEVEQTLQRAFEENHTTDIAVLELNTLKMAMNITFKDLRQVVVPAILTRLPVANSNEVFDNLITRWFPILTKFTHSEEDQIDCIETIVEHLLETTYLVPRMPLLLKHLYEMDILEEDPILEWYESIEVTSGPLKKIKDAAQPFIFWLNNAEADSSEDSD